MSSELASLFSRCKEVVPQFEVVERKPTPSQVPEETDEVTDTAADKQTTSSSSEIETRHVHKPPRARGRGRGQKPSRDPRESRTIFVGNIPNTCSRKQIHQLFKTCGKVESVRVRCLQVKDGKLPKKIAVRTHKQLTDAGTFNAYVVFSSEEEAERSLKLNGTRLDGRHLRVDLVAKKESTKIEESRLSVFVGNLPFTADEEKLRSCFSECGGVASVRIVRDSKTGIGKGFGFVSFTDKSGVMFAVRQSKKIELDGRKLRVFKSKDEQTLKSQKQAKFSGIKTDQRMGMGKKALPKKHKQPRSESAGGKASGTSKQRKGSAIKQRTSSSHFQRKLPSKRSGVK